MKRIRLLPMAGLAVIVGTTTPEVEAQEIPREAVRATLEYFHAETVDRSQRLVVETSGFPGAADVASVAQGLGIRTGTGSAIKECDAEARRCVIVGADRHVHLYGFTVTTPGREIELQVLVSNMIDVELEGEEVQRSIASLRRIILRNDGGWRVVSDEPMVIG